MNKNAMSLPEPRLEGKLRAQSSIGCQRSTQSQPRFNSQYIQRPSSPSSAMSCIETPKPLALHSWATVPAPSKGLLRGGRLGAPSQQLKPRPPLPLKLQQNTRKPLSSQGEDGCLLPCQVESEWMASPSLVAATPNDSKDQQVLCEEDALKNEVVSVKEDALTNEKVDERAKKERKPRGSHRSPPISSTKEKSAKKKRSTKNKVGKPLEADTRIPKAMLGKRRLQSLVRLRPIATPEAEQSAGDDRRASWPLETLKTTQLPKEYLCSMPHDDASPWSSPDSDVQGNDLHKFGTLALEPLSI